MFLVIFLAIFLPHITINLLGASHIVSIILYLIESQVYILINRILSVSGVYSFCFDNRLSRFSTKSIYFYLLSYAETDWQKYANDVQEFQGEVSNVTVRIAALLFMTGRS